MPAQDTTTFKQYDLPEPIFDAYSKDSQLQTTLGSSRDTLVQEAGSFQSANYTPGVSGYRFSANDAEFNFPIAVDSIDIPDTTTANSFHTDSDGNSWWGANVGTGISGANASITAAGAAKFKNLLIGGATIQYQVANSGMVSFGDGSDGAGVADGVTALAGATLAGSTYTLTRDVNYTDLTISTGIIINTAQYRIFGTGTLTMNGTAAFACNGSNGTDGTNGSSSSGAGGGAGGAAIAAGYFIAVPTGAAGGSGGNGQTAGGGSVSNGVIGNTGVTVANALGVTGLIGGAGGGSNSGHRSFQGDSGAGGPLGTFSAGNTKLTANWQLNPLLDVGSTGATAKFQGGGTAGGGGGGGGGGTSAAKSSGAGGGGGGAGSNGGFIAIYFRNMVIGASATISANAGNGGKGGNGSAAIDVNSSGGSGGGGGSGGNGGVIVLVYNTATISGSLSAAAGTKGAKGTGGLHNGSGTGVVDGEDGTAGNDGAAGKIYQFQLSM